MKTVGSIVIEAGLVPDSVLSQIKRWGFVPDGQAPESPMPVEDLVSDLNEAAESDIEIRLADPVLVNHYANPRNQIKGSLVLVDPNTKESARRTVTFAVHKLLGVESILLPWLSDAVSELATNGHSYIQWVCPKSGDARRAYLFAKSEVFVGDAHMLTVCEELKEH